MKVGSKVVVERRFSHGETVRHRQETTIVEITAKRAYLENGDWFALDDPRREVKPKYLDYIETATVLDE